jgi:hypothetical protein
MPFNQRTVKIIGIAVAAVVIILLMLPLLINVKASAPRSSRNWRMPWEGK